jgi:hypothetical protein
MRAFRAGLAALILIAVGAEFASGSARPGFSAENFFSFFTIVCNGNGQWVSTSASTCKRV